MKSLKIRFSNDKNEQLAARLELPVNSHPTSFVLFAHCFTCNKNLTAVRNIARALTSKGMGVLRFDFTGLGESEGDFADTNFSSNVSDLIHAADYLRREYEAPELIIGHSLGGAAVLKAASQIPELKAVATIGAPYAPQHVTHLFAEGLDEIQAAGQATVSIGGRPFTIKKDFIDDLADISALHVINNINLPLLVLHSPNDETVEVSNATQIYKAAQHPKSFISLAGADHLMSKKEDSLYAGSVIASWAERYLPPVDEVNLRTDKEVVVRIGHEGYTTDIKAGKHLMVADEPESVGGNDFGPTPYDYLTAGLGACTAMTMKMYADRKGWPLKEVTVHLEHDKIHASDCAECEQTNSKIDRFERIIEIEGELDEAQIKRLMEIADKCPVHRTLHNEVQVVTTLKR